MNLPSWILAYQARCNTHLDVMLEKRYRTIHTAWVETDFFHAIRYAIEGSGKRLRTILACLSYEYISKRDTPDALIDAFLGIEFLHSYTLVHDDLPAMDNDTLRRWKPTVWKQYGETMAILVGDALQTVWFELLANTGKSEVVREISRALGDLGVVRWQVRDTLVSQKHLSLERLLSLHDEKTGGFIAASMVVWGIMAEAREKKLWELRELGILLGRAFQIRDDILDHEWDSEKMGKLVQKDLALGKGIIAVCGIEKAKILLHDIEDMMLALCRSFEDEKWYDIVHFVVHRER